LSAYVNDICMIVALSAWCGAMWSNIRVAKKLRAAGYSIWTLNMRARFNAWKGTNIVLFLSCIAIFAAAILVLIVMQ
jgi:amino acid permease